MPAALIDLHYLPSTAYFSCLLQYERVILEKHEHFIKQTYRNRCHILGAHKIETLSVPVSGSKNIPIKDIKIDYSEDWVKNHWRTIRSAYGKAPFFEFFAHDFCDLLHRKESFLIDLNYNLLSLCLEFLQIDIPITFSNTYENPPNKDTVDVRSIIHPKKNFSDRLLYTPLSYPQVFGKNFAANLSVIDLLFCEGPNARSLLSKSKCILSK